MPCSSSYKNVKGLLFKVDSISTITVVNSSTVRVLLPTVFLKQRLTMPTNLSQKPPHQGAFSMINFQITLLFVKYSCISCECTTFCTSTALALKVFALSDIMVDGKPLRPQNRRNAWRKVGADKS